MTNADQIAREICRESCAFRGERPCYDWKDLPWPNPACDEPGCTALGEILAPLFTEARTAGFNEAKGRAVSECRDYEAGMNHAADRRAATGQPNTVALSKASAANDIATALQAMTPGGSDD